MVKLVDKSQSLLSEVASGVHPPEQVWKNLKRWVSLLKSDWYIDSQLLRIEKLCWAVPFSSGVVR